MGVDPWSGGGGTLPNKAAGTLPTPDMGAIRITSLRRDTVRGPARDLVCHFCHVKMLLNIIPNI